MLESECGNPAASSSDRRCQIASIPFRLQIHVSRDEGAKSWSSVQVKDEKLFSDVLGMVNDFANRLKEDSAPTSYVDKETAASLSPVI